ncbi:hypothetical protein VOLCADRAFT_96838 [Volvox carteri f. nagariensis]|uniref:Uncharacterized protein n=1 Tax=Volvox carteri f. nagariensis TaxID=3068 RepID=D8UB71_VOLCA|nr:uncharacterized protein VOLCADRAFT_96838 [Volvox carteri f. nagariensis]EFJ43120.1 hypothetical protein VOLCADRAFT_96838 [Volvox carteri f. nagariensis]|eukprot:XP_002955919.1 hypothetical protein VOLCADRAFT_96838 [Volvox carteri f. nagariensis]
MAPFCFPGADALGDAMKKCPFLHNIAQTHGTEYATSLACKSTCPSGHGSAHRPVLTEDDDGSDFTRTLALFHGQNGVLPLPHLSVAEQKVLYPMEQPIAPAEPERPRCPFSAGVPTSDTSSFDAPLFAAAPFASMSMSWGSNWFNIHHLFQKHLNQHRAQQRKPPQQPQQPRGNQYGGLSGPGLGGPGSASAHGAGTTGGGKCPLRRALGPLAGVVFNKHGHLSCPEPIVKMRAALAATRPVRELRPQALPIKLLAVAMTTAVLNVPCGMWREHTEKFSSQWFIAVHATIPFIAMLRKAVIMPKYAILFTICSAIAGQAMGARLERRRLLAAAKDELGGLAKASVAVSSTHSRSAAPVSRHQAPLPVASLLMSAQPLDRSVMMPLVASASAASVTHGSSSALWRTAQDGSAGDDYPEGFGAEGSPCGTKPLAVAGCADSPQWVAQQQQQQQQVGQVQFRVSRRIGRRPEQQAVRGGGGGSAMGNGGAQRLLLEHDPLVAPVAVMAMVPEVQC